MNRSTGHAWRGAARAFTVAALVLASSASAAASDEELWSPPALAGETAELPDGRDVVQRAIDFVASHDKLAFEALVTYEAVQENGQKLQFDMLQRVAIRRGDRIYWVTLHDDATTDAAWCQDGSFTLLKEPGDLWGRVEVPPTLSDALRYVSEDYGVVVPFVDLLAGDAEELWLGEDVEFVNYIAEAWSDGYWTDHIALRGPGADVQLWFRQGDEPFPVKMSIVRTDGKGQPGFTARFREWATKLPEGAIPEFVPPEGAERVEIAPVNTP